MVVQNYVPFAVCRANMATLMVGLNNIPGCWPASHGTVILEYLRLHEDSELSKSQEYMKMIYDIILYH